MTRIDLTPRQTEVLDYIRDTLREEGAPPTTREISAHFKWNSTNAAAEHTRALVRKGFISITPKKSRGIKLIDGTGCGYPPAVTFAHRCEAEQVFRKHDLTRIHWLLAKGLAYEEHNGNA